MADKNLNVKVGLIGVFDMLKFKNMSKTREQAIQAAPAKEVVGTFPINEHAKRFHPNRQEMIIEDIIDYGAAGAKCYTLKRADGREAGLFRAGQYVCVSLDIDGTATTRPYSICSSPKQIKEGKIAITVKTNPGGFAADWILANWKVGDKVRVSGAEGFMYYEPLRDGKNVVAIAGGVGITPYISMARAIRDGVEDFNLTVIFNSRTEDTILFKKEFDEIAAATDKVKIVHVLSREEKEGYEHGHITAELIEKYAPENYCVYICGPETMYRAVYGEVKKLGLKRRQIRHEAMGVTKTVWDEAGYPAECKDKVFNVRVLKGAETYEIKANANEPVLVAIERAGIKAPSRCRAGECGWCRSKLLSGEVFVPADAEYRRWGDKEHGYIHPCCSFATSDLVIEVPGEYLG